MAYELCAIIVNSACSVNPRRACVARVAVLGLCVCVCVCVCVRVCVSALFSYLVQLRVKQEILAISA